MNQDFRMGWPAALNCIPLETRKAHVTPPREVHGKVRTGFEALDYSKWQAGPSEADCHQRAARHITPVEAALRKRFKLGDRIRVVNYLKPGSFPYGDGDEGTVVCVDNYYVKCHMDKNRRPDGGCHVTCWGTEGMPDVMTIEVIAPPSTTDKPQGVWVTDGRKPTKPGAYAVRLAGHVYSGVHASYWDGALWRLGPAPDSRVGASQEHDWLDTTPSKQEDDGWVAWTGEAGAKCPVPLDSRVWIRWSSLRESAYQAHCVCGWDKPGSILAYRIVKEQA